jgi:hypothetical protein
MRLKNIFSKICCSNVWVFIRKSNETNNKEISKHITRRWNQMKYLNKGRCGDLIITLYKYFQLMYIKLNYRTKNL